MMMVVVGMSLLVTAALAQTGTASPSDAPKLEERASTPAKAQAKPPDPAKEFAKIEQYVRKRGSYTVLSGYVSMYLGLAKDSNQGSMGQVTSTSYISDLHSSRVAYLLDRGEMILTVKNGEAITIYLADKRGRLERAAMGKKAQNSYTNMSLAFASMGFETEKKFWAREVALNTEEADGAGR